MGYIKTFIINKHFKKIFKLLLIITLLLILTTLMYSLFNKNNSFIENLNGIDKSKTRIECSLVTSQINKHRDHPFAVKNGDWDTLVNKYSGNPRISMRTVNIDNISTIVDTKQFVFVHSEFPMVIISVFLNDKRYTIALFKQSQLSYINVENIMEALIKHLF